MDSEKQILKAIKKALDTGKRVELIPVKNGVRATLVKRESIGIFVNDQKENTPT